TIPHRHAQLRWLPAPAAGGGLRREHLLCALPEPAVPGTLRAPDGVEARTDRRSGARKVATHGGRRHVARRRAPRHVPSPLPALRDRGHSMTTPLGPSTTTGRGTPWRRAAAQRTA